MNIFQNWFSNKNFMGWKLNTVMDYVFFGAILLFGFLAFKAVIAAFNRGRTPEKAARRVAKRLRKLGGPGARVLRNLMLTPGKGTPCPCEMLYLAADQAYLVKVFWHGTQVSGKEDAEKWRLYYSNQEEWVENPLPVLQKQREAFVRILTERDIRDVKIDPLIVCADNYETADVNVRGVSCVVPYQRLREWRKKHPISERRKLDIPAVCGALESSPAAPGARS